MLFVLQSAAPQQMNTAFVNSPVTDNIPNKMMKFPGGLLYRWIRSQKDLLFIVILPPSLFHLHATDVFLIWENVNSNSFYVWKDLFEK